MEFPKWVEVHQSFVVRKDQSGAPEHISVPEWPEFHIARDGKVTVLVHDEDEEKRATSEKVEPKQEEPTSETAEVHEFSDPILPEVLEHD